MNESISSSWAHGARRSNRLSHREKQTPEIISQRRDGYVMMERLPQALFNR
jgi:hypothetical protein